MLDRPAVPARHRHRSLAVVASLALLTVMSACGDDDEPADTTSSPSSSSGISTSLPPTSGGGTTGVPTSDTTATSAPESTTPSSGSSGSSVPGELEQAAIWPAADVVFATPEEAAYDFVAKVLEVPVVLGEFQAGDSRSGEIELWFEADGNTVEIARGVILLRQLGTSNGWFVIGVANDNASITMPEAGDTIPAGPVTVEGKFRGFEASGTVYAYVAGDAGRILDSEQAMGGAMETPESFTVELDLSDAEPGSTVMIMVRGGVGLETDPGEIGAIPVVIGD